METVQPIEIDSAELREAAVRTLRGETYFSQEVSELARFEGEDANREDLIKLRFVRDALNEVRQTIRQQRIDQTYNMTANVMPAGRPYYA